MIYRFVSRVGSGLSFMKMSRSLETSSSFWFIREYELLWQLCICSTVSI